MGTLIRLPHSPLLVTERISSTQSPATLQTPTISPDKHDSPHSSPWHPCIAHGFSSGLTQIPSPLQTPIFLPPHSSPQLLPTHSSKPGEVKIKEVILLVHNNVADNIQIANFYRNWYLDEYIPRGIGEFGASCGRPIVWYTIDKTTEKNRYDCIFFWINWRIYLDWYNFL